MSAFVVGLTGQSGTGKSTACKYFAQNGFGVVDCDKVSREVTESGTECLKAITEAFSEAILNEDKSLNRAKLGGIVFSDKQKLAKLNSIIFPFITDRVMKLCGVLEASGYQIIVLDAPTLFESGAYRLCNAIVSVTAPREVLLARIMKRDSLTRTQAQKRLDSQLAESYLRYQSDFVVNNNGDAKEFEQKLARALNFIKEMAHEKSN